MHVLYFKLVMNSRRLQFVWETGGMDKERFCAPGFSDLGLETENDT